MNDRTPSQEFVNNVRKLWNLDKYSVQFLTNDEWIRFRDNPPDYLIRCSDKHLEGIWDAMQGDV
tara:strand:+ start:406 stop:597 length:192 start_codon:yes stop_codon:yes gene_type:complete